MPAAAVYTSSDSENEDQAPSTKHQAPSTKHQAPSTKHQALRTYVNSIKHQAPSTYVCNIKHLCITRWVTYGWVKSGSNFSILKFSKFNFLFLFFIFYFGLNSMLQGSKLPLKLISTFFPEKRAKDFLGLCNYTMRADGSVAITAYNFIVKF